MRPQNDPIFFMDFDGVLFDSVEIKGKAFAHLMRGYSQRAIDRLLAYHYANGGVSRYDKINWFYKEVLGKKVDSDLLERNVVEYGDFMKKTLFNKELIIDDSLNFVKQNFERYAFYITSGADNKELNSLCKFLNIESMFISINGSPEPKKQIISRLIEEDSLRRETIVMVGDSINDYDAALDNGIRFFGYNNEQLCHLGSGYLDTFNGLMPKDFLCEKNN